MHCKPYLLNANDIISAKNVILKTCFELLNCFRSIPLRWLRYIYGWGEVPNVLIAGGGSNLFEVTDIRNIRDDPSELGMMLRKASQ
jgi:hypothetical protein